MKELPHFSKAWHTWEMIRFVGFQSLQPQRREEGVKGTAHHLGTPVSKLSSLSSKKPAPASLSLVSEQKQPHSLQDISPTVLKMTQNTEDKDTPNSHPEVVCKGLLLQCTRHTPPSPVGSSEASTMASERTMGAQRRGQHQVISKCQTICPQILWAPHGTVKVL